MSDHNHVLSHHHDNRVPGQDPSQGQDLGHPSSDHEHSQGLNQEQTHGNTHGHGHGHGHGHKHDDGSGDQWSGEDYLKMPGVRETAVKTHESIVYALTSTGKTETDLKSLNLLEVGCGAGAVTQHLVGTFGTVHSIDTSPSMLLALSSHLPPKSDNLTWAIHTIHPDSSSLFAKDTPMISPISTDKLRMLKPPRKTFDVAVVNLVLHHIDDTSSFLKGLIRMLNPGGWVVITEFAVEQDGKQEDFRLSGDLHEEIINGKTDEHGSVNRPGHFHAAFTTKTITELLSSHGFENVHAEIRGRLPVFDDPSKYPLNLVAWGRKD